MRDVSRFLRWPGCGYGGYMLGASGSSPNGCNRFGVKNARAEEICGKKRGGLGKKGGGLGKKVHFGGQKAKFAGQKNCIMSLRLALTCQVAVEPAWQCYCSEIRRTGAPSCCHCFFLEPMGGSGRSSRPRWLLWPPGPGPTPPGPRREPGVQGVVEGDSHGKS